MIISQTTSLCPICKQAIQADITEEHGAIFLEKQCLVDGKFKVKIAKHSWYYKGLTSFHNALYRGYKDKKQCSMCVLFLTSQCNLNCPICFTNANSHYTSLDVPFDFIKAELAKIRNCRMVIRLSGGEPTLREDLVDIIQAIKQSGNIPQLFTNGLKLHNGEYIKSLKAAGLNSIIMWIDTMHREGVYETMRGRKLIVNKHDALLNIQQAKIPFFFYHVAAKGVNENDMRDCLKYAVDNVFVKGFWVRGYSHIGKAGLAYDNEFVVDELIEEVSRKADKAFTLEDVFNFQKIRYIISSFHNTSSCYLGPAIALSRTNPKHNEFRKLSPSLELFEKAYTNDPRKALCVYLPNIIKGVFKISPRLAFAGFRRLLTQRKGYFNPMHFSGRDYIFIIMSSFYSAQNFDQDRINRECTNMVFHLGVDKHVPLCSIAARNIMPDNTAVYKGKPNNV